MCGSFIELALVRDVSGSMAGVVDGLKTFAHSIVDQFVLGDSMARVSVTWSGWSS